jgi:hypothetical protein
MGSGTLTFLNVTKKWRPADGNLRQTNFAAELTQRRERPLLNWCTNQYWANRNQFHHIFKRGKRTLQSKICQADRPTI